MSSNPLCPQCHSDNHYPDGALLVCADCFNEWDPQAADDAGEESGIVKDSNGTVLADGDSVILIKDLKVKGSSTVLKGGTKVKSIRLKGEGDHEVDCKIDNVSYMLKACFLRKAN